MPDPLLHLKGLDAHYGDFQALYGIDMALAEGEVIAIIGANGAGKTTLMRSICGLLRNGAGQVVYRGQGIGALRADQVAGLGIALVPEALSSAPKPIRPRTPTPMWSMCAPTITYSSRKAGSRPGSTPTTLGRVT